MFNEHKKILRALQKHESEIPGIVTEMGAIAHTHFVKSFRDQGFTDKTLVKWKPRKRTWYRTRSGKFVDDTTRGILIGKGSGNLRRLRKRKIGKYTVDILSNQVTNKYARVHNEGLRAGRGRGFIMPKRQFIGNSEMLNRKIEAMIDRRIKRNMLAA